MAKNKMTLFHQKATSKMYKMSAHYTGWIGTVCVQCALSLVMQIRSRFIMGNNENISELHARNKSNINIFC